MDLGDYLENFKFNTFFLPKSVKRRLAAALPAAIAAQDTGFAGAAATVKSAGIRADAQKDVAKIGDTGETLRENLRGISNKLLENMRQSGMNKRLTDTLANERYMGDQNFRNQSDLLDKIGSYGSGITTPDIGKALQQTFAQPHVEDSIASPSKVWSDEDEEALNERWKEKSKKREWSTDEYLGL